MFKIGQKVTISPCFIALLTLSACANQHAVFRQNTISSGRPVVITEDAKQRNLFMLPEVSSPQMGQPTSGAPAKTGWRVCAEASPDVFSALSTSAAADLGFGEGTSGTEARAKAAFAIAEAAGTVERTQTINLLRESMYRTCERYLSGALGKDAFVVQAGRDWRAMIAILAIEQLTRVARAPATIIIPGSTNAVITSPSEFAGELRRAAQASENARIAKEAADKALADAGCDALPDEAVDEETAVKEKRTKCRALTERQTSAQLSVRRAEAAEEALSKAVGGQNGSPLSTGASTGGVSPDMNSGGGSGGGSTSNLGQLASAVKEITLRALQTDETQLFCLQALAAGSEYPTELRDDCRDLLRKQVQAVASGFSYFPGSGTSTAVTTNQTDLDRLSAYLNRDGADPVQRWRELLETLYPPAVVNSLTNGVGNLESILSRFKNELGSSSQQQIIEKIGQLGG